MYQVDFDLVASSLQQVGWRFLWILLVTYSAYYMATVAWALCMHRSLTQLPLNKLYVYRLVGETLALINPTSIIAGESSKIFLLKDVGFTAKEGVVSIMLSRVLIIMSMMALLLISIAFYFQEFMSTSDQFELQFGIVGLLFFCIIGLFLMLVHPSLYLSHLFDFIARVIPWSILQSQKDNIRKINQELHYFYRDKKVQLIGALGLSTGHWLMGALEVYLILAFLGLPISFAAAMMIEMGVVLVKSAGAFIPGQVGIEEYGNKLMLDLVGASAPGLWLTVSILRRARQLFWLMIGGICFLVIFRKI